MEKTGRIEYSVAAMKGDYPRTKLTSSQLVSLASRSSTFNNCASISLFSLSSTAQMTKVHPRSDLTVDFNDPAFNRRKRLVAHGRESWQPIVSEIDTALKVQGAFYLAYKNESHVAVFAYSSRLQVQEDLEKFKVMSKAPLVINSCKVVDSQCSLGCQTIADEILGGGKFAPGYERTHLPGCTHDFAVRGNLRLLTYYAGHLPSYFQNYHAIQVTSVDRYPLSPIQWSKELHFAVYLSTGIGMTIDTTRYTLIMNDLIATPTSVSVSNLRTPHIPSHPTRGL
ncbi:hypothetical protein NM688_g2442 [Phlebia brevispora]|uniref:Uncharacterized protein n=1 Tax=Phlebia brevispora TaxID=194682 RepID=A0ACC1T8V1_9APHY|nr:hypothetical protein NM688_g2442 [Phlebia brevispora]